MVQNTNDVWPVMGIPVPLFEKLVLATPLTDNHSHEKESSKSVPLVETSSFFEVG